ncbi:SDR family oxidoreductase [Filimonas effusa]|uniref:SDR family NAD(P)-dependent oxidoreductase n=1 Tax=Filimonas effusa TaxID=2508721 RepID=A0A4Q1D0Q3_9BACT|nr:SDR family NAD(P)-dependent oxidoreductase [Filimonas effusa]RXK80804.1 SDR family NAD(P)-dependent oxidoreductase [Filimonas effusa]
MNTTNNTVLIAGGSAGIGLEIAKLLDANGNTLIITGRSKSRLDEAASLLKNAVTIVSDISSEGDRLALAEKLQAEYPQLNMVINNGAAASIYPLVNAPAEAMPTVQHEIITNYVSVLALNSLLLPVLARQPEAAIVNVSSVVAYVPGILATYSASKAALHSYTQSLRWELGKIHPNIKVFELFPPLVNTEFSKPIGGEKGIPPQEVAQELLAGLASDTYEIRVGMTEQLYRLFLSSPEQAFAAMHTSERK